MNQIRLFLLAAATTVTIIEHSSAAAPAEFAGVPWGASPATVRQVIGARPGVAFATETPEQLTFTGGTFADESVSEWRFDFTSSKFRSATVALAPKSGKDAKGFLNDQIEWRILKLLEQKYGKAKKVEDDNHREYNWTFTDPLHPTETKTIRLFHGWATSINI